MSEYQRVPTSEDAADADELSLQNPHTRSTIEEFNRPAPAWWKRALIFVLIVVLAWIAIKLGGGASRSPEIVYASRYNDEFKYRPAESPVITEYLKDGRIRLRGAQPGGLGVRPEDIPLTPAQAAAKQKMIRDEANAKAREQFHQSKMKSRERRRAKRKPKATKTRK